MLAFSLQLLHLRKVYVDSVTPEAWFPFVFPRGVVKVFSENTGIVKIP
jgi:hypothetical protein